MKYSGSRRNLIAILVMALLLAIAAPATSFGKDHGRRGRGRDSDGWGRKCGKFVNCHDARNGRWDGRGPRRGWWDDNSRRRRVREWDWNNNFGFDNRRRYRNRDFDRDRFWPTGQRRFTRDRYFVRDDFWRNRQQRISRYNRFGRQW
jgi:hypothetical protein